MLLQLEGIYALEMMLTVKAQGWIYLSVGVVIALGISSKELAR